MTEKRFECYDLIFDGFIKDTLTNENIVEPIKLIHLLNEQDRKINVLKNSCNVMNQRLLEKEECNYKKAIIEFCKFMNINTPLLDVMVDEFLQEVF